MFQPDDIFSIASSREFHKMALKVFRFQYENNEVYKAFCDLLKKNPTQVKTIEQIPFLPIQFFKSHTVLSSSQQVQEIFTSSGTTGSEVSSHHVTDLSFYEESFRRAFSQVYGATEDYAVLALLPSYLEREGSSLVYMVESLIRQSGHRESGFYLDDYSAFRDVLTALDRSGQNVLVIGVTFALLDVIEQYDFQLSHTIIMETGGMKGRRKEIIREELHNRLIKGFGVPVIHSEYGMTELLSQAYSTGGGFFECPPWMEILIRDPEDALSYMASGRTGGINVIDLANINSCSFIATQDLGKKHSNHSFEVLGRFDNSDIRGCNLMVL